MWEKRDRKAGYCASLHGWDIRIILAAWTGSRIIDIALLGYDGQDGLIGLLLARRKEPHKEEWTEVVAEWKLHIRG